MFVTDFVHTSPFKNLKSGVGRGPFERFLLYSFFCDKKKQEKNTDFFHISPFYLFHEWYQTRSP